MCEEDAQARAKPAWRARVSAAAKAAMVTAHEAMQRIDTARARVREPVLLAYRDCGELQHLHVLAEFTPTEVWVAMWLRDLNATAAAISGMVSMLRATDDPLADVITPVGVALARLIAIVVDVDA